MIDNKAKFIMLQGTSSSAGKSTLTLGLLRYFSNNGISCSPFKSQNMSLNSFVTEDGFEIAVSQAIQSEAAFKKPLRQMNPILIKPASDLEMHLIVSGKHYGNMNFRDYNRRKNFFLKKAVESFGFLAAGNELIILEGAGSPAEINLFKYDIANMGFAQIYDIPVILAADIERGGVFASIYGTVKLLPPKWRKLIKGFIINKFRGDALILEPGIKHMEKILKIPCLGVIPYIKNLNIEAEDSLDIKNLSCPKLPSSHKDTIKIGIVRLEHISNFNEFTPLFLDDRINARFFDSIPESIDEFDMIIIPGSKSTIPDLLSMKMAKIFDYIKVFERNGGMIMGICGGFQMMGKFIRDPFHLESDNAMAEGLAFFNTETVLSKIKTVVNQKYRFNPGGSICGHFLNGYEIHNGKTIFIKDCAEKNIMLNIFEPAENQNAGNNLSPENGIFSKDNLKIGTYVHGLFGNDIFKNFITDIVSKNIISRRSYTRVNFNYSGNKNSTYEAIKNDSFNLMAENIEKYVDIKTLLSIAGLKEFFR